MVGGGDCCGVLPAAFHLLPFPNTFILRSVTQAKTFLDFSSSSVGSDPPNGDFLAGQQRRSTVKGCLLPLGGHPFGDLT